MIDMYVAEGTFSDKHKLAQDLGVVWELTDMVAAAANDPSLANRT